MYSKTCSTRAYRVGGISGGGGDGGSWEGLLRYESIHATYWYEHNDNNLGIPNKRVLLNVAAAFRKDSTKVNFGFLYRVIHQSKEHG